MTTQLLWLILFSVKHFIVDFLLQKPYQWMNKGTYGHPGGILHSGLHGIATLAILFFFVDPTTAIVCGLIDSVVHYHVDWAKMNLNTRMGWTATTHEEFWFLLGLDQLLHSLTYVFIIWSINV